MEILIMPDLDTLAARARAAYLDTDEAIPWDELKPCIRERWRAVVEAATAGTDATLAAMTVERDNYKSMLEDEVACGSEYIERAEALGCPKDGDINDAYTWALSEIAALRQRESVPVKVRFTQPAGMMEFRWLEICRKYGPENDVAGCPWLQDVICDFANYLAAHAVIDVPAGVPTLKQITEIYLAAAPDGDRVSINGMSAVYDAMLAGMAQPVSGTPTDAQVEALARVLSREVCLDGHNEDSWLTRGDGHRLELLRIARAAFAHIGAAPVGCTLDVTAEEMYREWHKQGPRDSVLAMADVLDLCRSRIRPVFECKECAKKETTTPRCDECAKTWLKTDKVKDECRKEVHTARELSVDLSIELRKTKELLAVAEGEIRKTQTLLVETMYRAALEGE